MNWLKSFLNENKNTLTAGVVAVGVLVAVVSLVTNKQQQVMTDVQRNFVVVESECERADGLMLVADRSTGIVYFATPPRRSRFTIQGVVYGADGKPMHVEVDQFDR